MVTKGDVTTFHNNKELEIALEQAKLETKGVNQFDQWSIPLMTCGEPRWDPTGLIFQSKETPILNFKAQDLEMIQVRKRLESLWQF